MFLGARELLELKDGGQVCLDWLNDGREHDETHPTVIILPGLTGSSQSEYVKSFVLSVQDAGARLPPLQSLVRIQKRFALTTTIFRGYRDD
ncbi:Phospholipase ABHD3 [Portunus trituberculatus]|uniref:Phospholipase ABHD3 n=1 Tax=Portunus trituberculatus TaxID=210409 RepID=A0A5B7JDZ6_PORTR|nr:Phospholipase ABHD3 [Portunus trituberculatus]